MVFLSPHQVYIKQNLPTDDNLEKAIDLHDFYLHFGFRHRQTAETAFRKAVQNIIATNKISNDQIHYLQMVYIDNDFVEVFDTNALNKYWNVTERDVEETAILKRQQETAATSLIIPVKSPKARRLSANTTKNNIYDLSNTGSSGQSTQAVNNIHTIVKSVSVALPPLAATVKDAIHNNFKKEVPLKIKARNIMKRFIDCDEDEESYFQLLNHIVESHRLNPKLFIIENLVNFSEMDLSFFFWSRVFLLLFSDHKNIIIQTGEKRLEGTSFKIDYKIGILIKNKFYTLSCIEIGRRVVQDKVLNDHHKLLLESKVIINNLIKSFSFINPASIPIVTLQICGLKGDFMETTLLQKKKYIAHRPKDRIRAPLHCNDIALITNFMKSLLFYKNHIVDLVFDVQLMINENDERRASFGEKLGGKEYTPTSFLDFIDDVVERI